MKIFSKKREFYPILKTQFKETNVSDDFDFYHSTLKSSLFQFIGNFVIIFLGLNAFFGFLYFLQLDSIKGVEAHTFLNCFFFSVQTMGTIGYGAYTPNTLYAHFLATIEVMIGLVGIGTFAAITFARISLPSGRLKFSDQCVVNEDQGDPKLMFRVVHLRNNMIMKAKITLQLLLPVTNQYQQIEMILHDLDLENDYFHVMTGSWVVTHRINTSSPLYNKTQENLIAAKCCLIATITGVDGTISQGVNYVQSFLPKDILWGKRFKSIIRHDEKNNEYIIDLNLVNTIEDAFVTTPIGR